MDLVPSILRDVLLHLEIPQRTFGFPFFAGIVELRVNFSTLSRLSAATTESEIVTLATHVSPACPSRLAAAGIPGRGIPGLDLG